MSVGADVLQEGPGVDAPEVAEVAARSPLQLFWRRLREDKVALGALAFLILLVLVAFPLAPLLLNARVRRTFRPCPNCRSTVSSRRCATRFARPMRLP